MKLLLALLPAVAFGQSYFSSNGECVFADGSAVPPSGGQMMFGAQGPYTDAECEAICSADATCVGYHYVVGPGCKTFTAQVARGNGGPNSQLSATCYIKNPATIPPSMSPTPAPVTLPCKQVNDVTPDSDPLLREFMCDLQPGCVYLGRKNRCKKNVIAKCKTLTQAECNKVDRPDCHQIWKKNTYKRCCSLDYGSDYQITDNNYCDPTTILQCKNQGEVDCRGRADCVPLYDNNSMFLGCCNPDHGSRC